MDNKKLLISMLRDKLKHNEKIKDFSDKLRPLIDLKDERSVDMMVEDRALFSAMVHWYSVYGSFDKLNYITIMRRK
jgi:hypothetical protein